MITIQITETLAARILAAGSLERLFNAVADQLELRCDEMDTEDEEAVELAETVRREFDDQVRIPLVVAFDKLRQARNGG